MRCAWWIMVVLFSSACGASAGKYGYAREYVPLPTEEAHIGKAVPLSYEEIRREPEAHTDELLGWFGEVQRVERLPSGEFRLSLTQRFHQPRHLCRDHSDDSCRVTVTRKEGGVFSTALSPRSEDMAGRDKIQVGALMKIYGEPTGDFDDEGGPVLATRFYRHWPVGTYVSTGGRGAMRR